MSTDLTRTQDIKLDVALIKSEINEFHYNEHDVDYQFNQIVDWGIKLKHLAEKLILVRTGQELLKKAQELDTKWNNIGKSSFFAFDDEPNKVEKKHYPNRSKRYKFTKEQIRLIRQTDKTNKEVAKIVGCSPSLICQIKNKGIYKKV